MKEKNFENILYSGAGVAAMFALLLAVNVLASAFKLRVDLTAEKAYTLSAGTRKIIAKLDSPVTIRFYCSQETMPAELKPFAQQVEDLLEEYQQIGKGKIILKKLDPQPDTDAEDSARIDGVQGRQTSAMGGDLIYLGLSISRLDQHLAIPWLDPGRERLLEYDISRAISRAINTTPATIGVMSVLPVLGSQPNPIMMQMGQQAQDPWIVISELKNDFNVKEVPMTSPKIDDDIKVLLVIEPRDITELAQYAIDQFVMRGGKLIAFLDPHCITDQQPGQMQQIMGESSGSSSLPRLLRAWGLDMDVNKVVADMDCAYHEPGTPPMPTVLMLTRKEVNEDDVVTGEIDNMMMLFAGAITGKAVDGLKETVLVQSSTESELVESLLASRGSDEIIKDFKPSGTHYPLAVRLTGTFRTAFPEGKPKPSAQAGETNLEDTLITPQLKESPSTGAVILVSDADMLADKFCAQVENIFGQRIAQPINGNLNFVQSCVEQMAGDSDLISLRSRGSLNRPFTRLQDLESKAGRQWEDKVKQLEAVRDATQSKISELQSSKAGGAQLQKEIEDYEKTAGETAKQLRQVQKQLRKDTDSLEAWIRVINIGAMPALVAVTGIVLAIVKRKRTAAK